MSLPNSSMSFTPFDTLPASDLNDLVENIESLSIGTGLDDNAIAASKLATNAITLGYAERTSNFTTAGTNVAVTSLSVNVTIPAGGRKVKITVWAENMQHTSAVTNLNLSIWDGAAGSGTRLQNSLKTVPGSNYSVDASVIAVITPAAGAKTYSVGFGSGSATATLTASATSPAFILVEAI